MIKMAVYIRLRNEQTPGGRAVSRNRPGQSHQIQYLTLNGVHALRRILQKGLCLLMALEVYSAASYAFPVEYSINKILFNKDASGYRANGSGDLSGVGGNGNFWSYAPNSQANARNLNFNSSNVNPLNTNNRSNGFSVRPCRAFDTQADTRLYDMKYTYQEVHWLTMSAYLQARQEQREKCAQLEFEMDLENNLNTLSYEIYSRRWKPEPLHWFVLTRPSIREVFAPQFRDRVVSHVLFMMISPVFERHFIYDSFSCRRGKGTLRAIERLEHHIRGVTRNYQRDAYSLNMDISGYFMSIRRDRLYELTWEILNKHRAKEPDLMDYELAEYLTAAFLFRDPLAGCVYHGNPALKALVLKDKSLFGRPAGVGLPIGDVINQLNSNIYLNPFDWFMKKEMHIRHYVRYVDDVKALHPDREYLTRCRDFAGEYLDKRLGLRLHPNKTTITSVLDDTSYFLGAAIRPHRRFACNEVIDRFKAYISSLDGAIAAGAEVDYHSELARLNSRLGHLCHFNEKTVIRKALSRAPHVRSAFLFTAGFNRAVINPNIL